MAEKQDTRDAAPDEPEATSVPATGEEPAGTTRESAKKAAKKTVTSKKAAKKKVGKKASGEGMGKKTPRKKAAKRVETGGPTEEEIRRRAYEIWERRGREPGSQKAHWLEAERQLREESRG